VSAVYTAAQQAHKAGLTVLPVRPDGSKAPAIKSWKAFTTRPPTATEWSAMGWETAEGLGVISGSNLGVGCFDFDDADTYQEFLKAARDAGLGAVVDRVCSGYTDQTPSGGYRWIVKFLANKVVWKDITLAVRLTATGQKVLIEMPTFSVVAPSNGSTHPSQRPYVRVAGDFTTIESVTAEEHEALITLARTFDERPRPGPRKTGASNVCDRPGDLFNREATWPEILGPHLWEHIYDRGVTEYWRRPGKDQGISATVNHSGSDLLYMFSSSTQFEAFHSYSKFGAYAILNYGGDFKAAARALKDSTMTRAHKVQSLQPDQSDQPRSRSDQQRLDDYGIYTQATLKKALENLTVDPWLVHGFIRASSITLFAGDSGLGKTPLLLQLALCIAAGLPFLGAQVQQGRVLYCDGESNQAEFNGMVNQLCQFLRLVDPKGDPLWPADFVVWNPTWVADKGSFADQLYARVTAERPVLVCVDPLRIFWPEAEQHAWDATASLILPTKKVIADLHCAFAIIHHMRKPGEQAISLVDNPTAWFQDVAGSRALINHTDTRLGVELSTEHQADLALAGFIRGLGAFPVMQIARASDEDGNPMGYELLTGIEMLNARDREIFNRLPARFHMREIKTAFEGSGSNAVRFKDKCLSIKILRKNGSEYAKTKGVDFVDFVDRKRAK
jgi:hypothetical protein